MLENRAFVKYDLAKARQSGPFRMPFGYQSDALNDIRTKLFEPPSKADAGGIVVLPTGGGKTFTASRFLCSTAIPAGYKVLWLAHTHHLLDQAFSAFGQSVGTIREPKMSLSARVVSGTPGHNHVHQIEKTDDVVVATLQTITAAYADRDRFPTSFKAFLDAAGDRLCVVFDEAHHAPAPSYRRLLRSLRADHAEMILIGLTATPNLPSKKVGWLRELFPRGIIHQSTATTLLADGVLARPSFEKIPTAFSPEFDEREYQGWVETYRDLPEHIIESLAENRERNALIAGQYAGKREVYGRTIIFAERWYQCEAIATFLREKHGVRADSVYSKVDGGASTSDTRNTRTADHNHVTLEKFKRGDLDVLLNVRMLTEGTDVPDVQTVFITRQTTSAILLTQMVGRALRGPKAGGTENAYIVSFEDNWKLNINWAEYDQLVVAPFVEVEVVRKKARATHLISVDLVRRLTEQMDSGVNVAPAAYLKLLPVGWYRVEFQVAVEGSEDVESFLRLVMVFENQEAGYREWLVSLAGTELGSLASERAKIGEADDAIDAAIKDFLPDQTDAIGRVDRKDLFHILRHVAQNDNERPDFFRFEERDACDLDAVAKEYIEGDYGTKKVDELLKNEFTRQDRFWRVLYPHYDMFKTQYEACINRLLKGPLPPPHRRLTASALLPTGTLTASRPRS